MKNQLKQVLSHVSDFEQPHIKLEQYLTPPSLAADLIFTAYMQRDIENKKVLDLGAGTGILGIGASKLGAKVTAVEKDGKALKSAEKNAENLDVNIKFVKTDIRGLKNQETSDFDTVVMNPPFSVHSDIGLTFWKKAVELSTKVYGISPRGARDSIKSLVRNTNHRIVGVQEYNIGLPPTYGFHTEEHRETPVDLIITEKEEK